MTATTSPDVLAAGRWVFAEVRHDGTGEYAHGGEKTALPPADDLDGARGLLIQHLRRMATQSGEAVPVVVADPEGEFHLSVPAEGPPTPLSEGPPRAPRVALRPVPPPPEPPAPAPEPVPVPVVASPRRSGTPTARPAATRSAPPRRAPAPPAPVQPVTEPPTLVADLPTLADLRAKRTVPRSAPATRGWQGAVRTVTCHAVSPAPGKRELQLRSFQRAVTRSLPGPRTITVANGKGGAPKTSSLVALARVIAEERGGDIVLVDNNPFIGNLADRAGATNEGQTNTIVELVRDLDRITSRAALNNYLRDVEGQHFKVLASTEDTSKQQALTGEEFAAVHRLLSRWFSVVMVDTSNDITAANFRAAIDVTDQLVVPMSLGQASIVHAMQLMAALESWGRIDLARNAVGVMVRGVTGPNTATMRVPQRKAEELFRRARDQFAPPSGWMREFLEAPIDPVLAGDQPVEYERMRQATRDAWLEVAAAVAKGL